MRTQEQDEAGRESREPQSGGSALERRIGDLSILYEVSRALQGTLEEEQSLHTILTGVTHGRGLGFNRAFICLHEANNAMLEGRRAVGPSSPEEARAIWRDLRDRHATLSEILSRPRPAEPRDLHVNEVVSRIRVPLSREDHPLIRILHSREIWHSEGGRFRAQECPAGRELTDLLETDEFAAAPLHQSGNDLGVLIVDNRITGAPITRESLRLLQIYAQAAGASIRNAGLRRELMNRLEICESTNRALRESQEQLLQAERLSAIGKMAAMLAHEIRTPLTSIGGFARRLRRRTPAQDPRSEEIEIIVSEVTRLELLIEEVLGYTRITPPSLEPTDINSLARSVVATMRDIIDKGSIRVAFEFQQALPEIRVDPSQIRQALMNVISNALEAMPGGGLLTLAACLDGSYLEIGISDTGTGIAREHREKLYAPFFTTKSTGTGLGLAVVSQIIKNHKGSMRFDSVQGKGSSFFIRLPLDPEASSERNRPETVKT